MGVAARSSPAATNIIPMHAHCANSNRLVYFPETHVWDPGGIHQFSETNLEGKVVFKGEGCYVLNLFIYFILYFICGY